MPIFDSIVYNIIVVLVPESLIHYADSQGLGKWKIINDITAKNSLVGKKVQEIVNGRFYTKKYTSS